MLNSSIVIVTSSEPSDNLRFKLYWVLCDRAQIGHNLSILPVTNNHCQVPGWMVHSQEMLKCFRLYAGQVLAHNISLDIDKLSLWRVSGRAHHKSNSQVCPVCKKFSGYRRCHCMNPLRCNPNVQWDVFTATKPDIWAKCCMLVNQPDRLSLFLVKWLLVVVQGTVHVLSWA